MCEDNTTNHVNFGQQLLGLIHIISFSLDVKETIHVFVTFNTVISLLSRENKRFCDFV